MSSVSVDKEDNRILFSFASGGLATLYHQQDCCENVWIEDVCGGLNDLVGHPLLMAEERSNMADLDYDAGGGSETWTFYRFATIKGYVTIRWCGSSNGYYSERVDFKFED